MKTEEIKPGDILYDEERKMLVKVARVDEDGVVKYSAITDMKRIFQTPPPPIAEAHAPQMPTSLLRTSSASIWKEIWQCVSM